MTTPFHNAAAWKLTLSPAPPAGAGTGGALAAAGAAVMNAAASAGAIPGATPSEVKLNHTLFRADITVSKGLGLDGGRVKLVIERIPFRMMQDILAAYDKAQEAQTPSKAKGALIGVLKLYWRVGLPYPGLDEAADLIQSAAGDGDDDKDVAARFVVTGLSVESEKASYKLVIEGVDKAWYALSTERVEKSAPLAAPDDVKALCGKIGVDAGPPAAGGGLPFGLPSISPPSIGGLGAAAAGGGGGGKPPGGAAIVTARERVIDRLRAFEPALVDAAKAEGLGGYLIDNGRLLFGKDVVEAFKAAPNDLSGGLEVLSIRASERDLGDTSGAEQAFSLQIRGDATVKPGQAIKFLYKSPKAKSPSTGLGFADAAIGMATDPLGLKADGDPVCLYVRAVRHRQGSKVGFVTEIDGVVCGKDSPEIPKKADRSGPQGGGKSAEGAAGAIHSAIESRRPRTVDVGELRVFRSQAKGGAAGQTGDLLVGLDADKGRVQSFRTVDIQRKDPQRASAAPYVTPFAWGPFGLVLPRYPGMRLALLRPEGKPEEALDVGALWWSGKEDNAGAGPAEAQDGDYWLILPVDPNVTSGGDEDTGPIAPEALAAAHDLIDAKGRRTVQVRELTLRVGEWTLKAPGERPGGSAAPGGLRIEGKDGAAFLEIDEDGAIRILTPKSLTLQADEGIQLKSAGVTVDIKNGAVDVT
ncbi:hypothetical protein ACFODL_05055 [Phenylobacterium terrae]|uniref:Gp5/Type VI secretion system Vgr protein OB-fold domain-containing protein n=1 Tax=Phenylobacterium terrae TaxID=2665495 RepID=A0ABW4MVX2_9CAUL